MGARPVLWAAVARSLRAATGLLGLALLWWAAVHAFDVPTFLLPSPRIVGAELMFLAGNADLAGHAITTASEILGGFAIGAIAGGLVGVAFARRPALERLAAPLVLLVQTAPKIALAPLLLLWLGLGPTPKLMLVAVVVFFPAMSGALAGMRYIDPPFHDLAHVLRLGPWQRLRRIELPFAYPSFLAALRIATTQAVTAAVIGELMGANRGLGYLLVSGQENSDAPMVIAVVLVLCVLGWLFHEAVALVEGLLPAGAQGPSA